MWRTVICTCTLLGGVLFGSLASASDHPLTFTLADPDEQQPAEYRTRGSGWTSTSSGTSGLGSPVVLTWSIVPDGTTLPRGVGEPSSPSNLIGFLDGLFHGGASPGGADLTGRAWWQLFNSSFERWEQLAGITFTYEPNDDGALVSQSLSSQGVLGTRGDHRLGGHYIDGSTRPSTLAYSYFPNFSDMVIDTSESGIYGNPGGNYLRLRNMLMHETGHGLGIDHVESDDVSFAPGHQFGSFLMEPILTTAFDGPQFDDILAAQRLYGDVYEKGTGNQTYQTATDLGMLATAGVLTIGADAVDKRVEFTDVDFVSIDDNSDIDYFRFTIDRPTLVNLTLTPMGPSYLEGNQGAAAGNRLALLDASALGDLNLTLYDQDGITSLGSSFTPGLGLVEQILEVPLVDPGEYFVRIGSISNNVQMFQLDIASVPEPATWTLLLGLASSGLAWRYVRRDENRGTGSNRRM